MDLTGTPVKILPKKRKPNQETAMGEIRVEKRTVAHFYICGTKCKMRGGRAGRWQLAVALCNIYTTHHATPHTTPSAPIVGIYIKYEIHYQ